MKESKLLKVQSFDLLPGAVPSKVEEVLQALDAKSREAVRSIRNHSSASLNAKSCVISFSGGIDSSILAKLVHDTISEDVPLVCVGRTGSQDVAAAKHRDGDFYASPVTLAIGEDSLIREAALEVCRIIKRPLSLSHLEDLVAFWLISRKTLEEFKSSRYLLTANGPDELFCGYDRFRRIADSSGYQAARVEIAKAIPMAISLARQVGELVSAATFGKLVVLNPFLSEEFVSFSQHEIPVEYKLQIGDDKLRKRIWRLYGKRIGLPDKIVYKPKKAMQYSMGVHKIVHGMLKRGELDVDFSKLTH